MDLLKGINTSELPDHNSGMTVPVIPTVKGRTVHIDADFLAYMVSGTREELSLSEMYNNLDVLVEKLRLMSGAEHTLLHLTPSGSTKGGRPEQAMQKEYQANRKGKEKPAMLHVVREFMHKERGAILCAEYEADDSMAMYQYEAIRNGTPELSVIASKDKDLRMIPGLQVDWDTGEMTDTGDDPFGWIEIKIMGNKSKTKKVIGRGWKFFWAQMLMGDTADNIKGLPKIIHPEFTNNKLKACGPVMAYEVLKDITNNKDAFKLVKELYKATSEKVKFVNYRNDEPITVGQMMLSEMQLLWMRRYNNEKDVLEWLKETTL